MVVILDFGSKQFWLFFIYKSPQSFLPSFKPIGLLVQENTFKIDFQDGHHDGHLLFPNGTILAFFDLQVTLMIPTKSIGLSVQEKKFKIDFQDGCHLGFLIGMI